VKPACRRPNPKDSTTRMTGKSQGPEASCNEILVCPAKFLSSQRSLRPKILHKGGSGFRVWFFGCPPTWFVSVAPYSRSAQLVELFTMSSAAERRIAIRQREI
jgi:hypothetical protein